MSTLSVVVVGDGDSQANYSAAARRIRRVEVEFVDRELTDNECRYAVGSDAVLFDSSLEIAELESLLDLRKTVLAPANLWSDPANDAFSLTAVTLFPNRLWRFHPRVMSIKASLESGELGSPGLLRIHRWSSGGVGLDSTQFYSDVDLACWLFNSAPKIVYASRYAAANASDSEASDGRSSYMQLHLGFPNGGSCVVDLYGGLSASETYDSISLIGSKGAVYADDHRDRQLVFRGGGPIAPKSSFGHLACQLQLEQLVHQVEAVQANKRSVDEVESMHSEMRRAWRVVQCAAASMTDGESKTVW